MCVLDSNNPEAGSHLIQCSSVSGFENLFCDEYSFLFSKKLFAKMNTKLWKWRQKICHEYASTTEIDTHIVEPKLMSNLRLDVMTY